MAMRFFALASTEFPITIQRRSTAGQKSQIEKKIEMDEEWSEAQQMMAIKIASVCVVLMSVVASMAVVDFANV